MTGNKILHLFVNCSMSLGHKGLDLLAKKEKVDLATLAIGEFALFANRRLTALKVFGSGHTVIHYKAPTNRPIDVRALKHLPTFMNGNNIQYDRSILHLFLTEYGHLFKGERP